MEKILSFVSERFGIDPKAMGVGAIEAGIRDRIRVVRACDPDDYLRMVLQSDEERISLRLRLAVPETWFFRDDACFDHLRTCLREPAWQARRPLRILSVPCASGEEPASIAMTLIDIGLRPSSFAIEAFDVHPEAIEKAEGGVYSERSFRGKNVDFRDRFFQKTAEGWRLDPLVRRTIDYRIGDLLERNFATVHDAFEIIFCKNLLIYFGDEARARVTETLDRLLIPGGLLFAGYAEVPLWTDRLQVSEGSAFALEKKRPEAPQKIEIAPRRPPPPPLAVAPVETPPSPNEERIEIARELADAGKLNEAEAVCSRFLSRAPDSAEAHFLLGIIWAARSERDKAEQSLRRAIYLDPQHASALFHLALLLEERNDTSGAALMRRRAMRETSEE